MGTETPTPFGTVVEVFDPRWWRLDRWIVWWFFSGPPAAKGWVEVQWGVGTEEKRKVRCREVWGLRHKRGGRPTT